MASPSDYSNLDLWVTADTSHNFSDDAGTTPAVAAGTVRYAEDRSGNGNHLTVSDFGGGYFGPPTLTSTAGGYVYQGTNKALRKILASAYTPSDWTLHWYGRFDTETYHLLFGLEQGAGANFVGAPWVQGDTAFGSGVNGLSAAYGLDGFHLMSFVLSGGTLKTYLDGVEINSATISLLEADSYWLYGTPFNLQDARNTSVGEVAIYKAAQSAANVAAWYQDVIARQPAERQEGDGFVLVSNSLGTSFVAGYPSFFGSLCSEVAGFSKQINASYGGRTTTQMSAVVDTVYGPLLDTVAGTKVAIVWEGTNDIATNGASGATAAANVLSLCDDLHDYANCAVVVGTILPRNVADFDAKRLTANAAIIAGAASRPWLFVADVGADTTIGEDGDEDNATYYSDGVHLTAAGNAIAAPYFADAAELALEWVASTASPFRRMTSGYGLRRQFRVVAT